jgi:hypothetical protein
MGAGSYFRNNLVCFSKNQGLFISITREILVASSKIYDESRWGKGECKSIQG